MLMMANPKLYDSQSKTQPDPVDVFPFRPRLPRPVISDDPRDILRCLVLADGCVKKVGEICEKNPKAAQWLLQKIEDVDDLRVRNGKPSGRFDAYANAARQALCRVECNALLVKMFGGN